MDRASDRMDGPQTALITGASSGLGVDFARQMSPWCRCLILVARRLDKLEGLKKELSSSHPTLLVYCQQLDLRIPEDVENLVRWIEAEKLEVTWLVNNAGLGDINDLASAEWTRVRSMLQVNMFALTQLTYRLLPAMINRGWGRIINVGSIAGYLALPGFAVYAASKAYVNSFSEALFWELDGTGVTVTAVCPGPVHTEFIEVAAPQRHSKTSSTPKFVEISSAEVVRQSLFASKLGRPRVVPGLFIWIGSILLSLMPLRFMRILYRFKLITAP